MLPLLTCSQVQCYCCRMRILQQVQTQVGIQMGSEQLEAMRHVSLLPHVFTVLHLFLASLIPSKVSLNGSKRENLKWAIHEVWVLLRLHIDLGSTIGIESGAPLCIASSSKALPEAVGQQNSVGVYFHNPIYIFVLPIQLDLLPDNQKQVFVFEHAFPVGKKVMRDRQRLVPMLQISVLATYNKVLIAAKYTKLLAAQMQHKVQVL